MSTWKDTPVYNFLEIEKLWKKIDALHKEVLQLQIENASLCLQLEIKKIFSDLNRHNMSELNK